MLLELCGPQRYVTSIRMILGLTFQTTTENFIRGLDLSANVNLRTLHIGTLSVRKVHLNALSLFSDAEPIHLEQILVDVSFRSSPPSDGQSGFSWPVVDSALVSPKFPNLKKIAFQLGMLITCRKCR